MYKCTVFHCEGAWGAAPDMWRHLRSDEHAANMAKSQLAAGEAGKAVEVIVDDERYMIQATRLPWFRRRLADKKVGEATTPRPSVYFGVKYGLYWKRASCLFESGYTSTA